MYCTKCGQDSAELLRMLADAKRRIRRARKAFFAAKFVAQFGKTDLDKAAEFMSLLDIRKPLKRGKS